MTKPILALLLTTGLCVSALAETPEETIANLKKEISTLRIAVGQAEKPIVLANKAEVEVATARSAAVDRVNEANQVARQWRSRAIALEKELSYTKAILLAQGGAPAETTITEQSILLPGFRMAELSVRPAVAVVNAELAVHAAYVAAR